MGDFNFKHAALSSHIMSEHFCLDGYFVRRTFPEGVNPASYTKALTLQWDSLCILPKWVLCGTSRKLEKKLIARIQELSFMRRHCPGYEGKQRNSAELKAAWMPLYNLYKILYVGKMMQRGITCRALADELGVSFKTVWNWNELFVRLLSNIKSAKVERKSKRQWKQFWMDLVPECREWVEAQRARYKRFFGGDREPLSDREQDAQKRLAWDRLVMAEQDCADFMRGVCG